jgi:ribosomal protein S18 acetylase RimI-like enzyme
MATLHFRTALPEDVPAIISLYKAVAAPGNGIARAAHEITEEYVSKFVESSLRKGVIIVGEDPADSKRIVAELHAVTPAIDIFRHTLTNLTIAVHPEFQGRKIGRTIFTIFLEDIARNRPDIGRVELFVRETNARAIQFYQSLGFMIEGRLEMRIKNPDKTYEADIPMGWQNPNFDFDL